MYAKTDGHLRLALLGRLCRVPELLYGIIVMFLNLAILVELIHVTDRRMDGETDTHMATAYTMLA